MYKILFVCTGNTCRSPMAETIARDIFKKHGLKTEVLSAGVHASNGAKASPNAIYAMKKMGLNLKNHKAQLINEHLIEWSNIILTMTKGHYNILKSMYPKKAEIFTLGEYIGINEDISDPFGLDEYVYISLARELKNMLESIAEKLQKEIV